MELISIIVPTYKRSIMISKTIKSLLSQTYTNVEIIIVDDNNPNSIERSKTEGVLKEYIGYNNVKYIKHSENKGGSEARNTGIKHASGKYITFLDDDDEYYKDKVEKQYIFYKKTFEKDDGFINCKVNVFRNDKFVRKSKSKVDYDNLLFSVVSEKILGTPTLFIPKYQLESVGGFKILSKGQEWFLCLKLIEAGYKFKSMKEALVRVNIHKFDSISNGQNSVEKKSEGLTTIYEIQKNYFEYFNQKQIREINYNYTMAMAACYLNSNKKESLKYFFKSFLNYRFDRKTLKYMVKFFLNYLQKSNI
ncbi:glycosyltransferase family 2 protein [Clostridium sp.]|uniref:glycosyltransferase family 2 protein n=1 Tax=Clostridium sp. TaxID=1506 RepID=UPI003D6CB7BC